MNELKLLDNLSDEQILVILENIVEELETLDPGNKENNREIEETKRDLIRALTWSINTDDITVLDSILKKLLNINVIKLTQKDIKNLRDVIEKEKESKKNNPENIEHIRQMEILLNEFSNTYNDSTNPKWTGSIMKRRKSNVSIKRTKDRGTRRKIGSNIKIKR